MHTNLAQCISKAFQMAHDRPCHSQTLLIVYLAECQDQNTTHKVEEYSYCALNLFKKKSASRCLKNNN